MPPLEVQPAAKSQRVRPVRLTAKSSLDSLLQKRAGQALSTRVHHELVIEASFVKGYHHIHVTPPVI